MWKLLFVVSLLMSFYSCNRKELSFTISGNITDATFSQDLSEGSLELYIYGVGSSFPKLLEETSPDSEGKYSFEVDREKAEKFEIRYEGGNRYFSKQVTIPFSDLEVNEENMYEISTTAKSWARFVIKNQSNPSADDEFKFLKQGGKTDCDECCADGYSYYYGAVDTVIYCINDGNTYLPFYYWINGTEEVGQFDLYTTVFDTTSYEFIY